MSTFTFQLNASSTNTNALQLLDSLSLEQASAAEQMGAQIATAQFTMDLNNWMSLKFGDGENPITHSDTDVTYKFDADKTKTVFAGASGYSAGARGDDNAVDTEFANLNANALVNWHILNDGAHASLNAYGWANRLPAFGVKSSGSSAVTGSAAIVDGTDISLFESIIPKRVMAAYGADVVQLLDNEAAVVSDVRHRLLEAIDAFIAAFAASSNSNTSAGSKIWKQAVKAASDESGGTQELTDRLGAMIDTITEDDDGDQTFPFLFANGDVLELELQLVKPETAAEPETSEPAGAGTSRDEATLLYKIKIVHADA